MANNLINGTNLDFVEGATALDLSTLAGRVSDAEDSISGLATDVNILKAKKWTYAGMAAGTGGSHEVSIAEGINPDEICVIMTWNQKSVAITFPTIYPTGWASAYTTYSFGTASQPAEIYVTRTVSGSNIRYKIKDQSQTTMNMYVFYR